jgi:two-component system response regulator WspF
MRVAIVNDLKIAIETLRRVVVQLPGVEIAWTAENGTQAVERVHQDCPDVILMDLVMPGMDGVEATRRIMQEHPCSILLVTSSVSTNLPLVYQAMGFGGLHAIDYHHTDKLLAHLRQLQNARNTPQRLPCEVPLVALGASTGGPEAVATILSQLPAKFPAAVVVIQHMAGEFIANYAQWLRGRSALPVDLAQAGERPRAGQVAVAAQDEHLVLVSGGRMAYTREPADNPHTPSADVFFRSAATYWPEGGVAVLLTGMGEDGAAGLLTLRQARWQTIAQDEASCVVYGMPKAAAQRQAACLILPLTEIARAIQAAVIKK